MGCEDCIEKNLENFLWYFVGESRYPICVHWDTGRISEALGTFGPPHLIRKPWRTANSPGGPHCLSAKYGPGVTSSVTTEPYCWLSPHSHVSILFGKLDNERVRISPEMGWHYNALIIYTYIYITVITIKWGFILWVYLRSSPMPCNYRGC